MSLCLWFALAMSAVAPPLPAWAHRQATGRQTPPDSISIPNLSHGQMAVIADNRTAILDLAARQMPTDPTMRRLQAFINLQFFDCMWGIVPRSLEDENSPFNECSHAYLAATRALLVHLQDMPGDRAAVRSLVAKIEREMLNNSASLVMCRYSDEPFNTAERIEPHWGEIPFHLPSMLTFMGLALGAASCAWMGIRWRMGLPWAHKSLPGGGRFIPLNKRRHVDYLEDHAGLGHG
jgi:hypothetical protein